ncbi:aminotransferase class V-fold PLP-dependent enzyme [Patulibacter sp.]|uniref:aminotransferase class V-fold PLP-dependent enzyme n=1 Tax=Patulibacter sp. TaxID=1912859 RepID=UPI0027268F01|nr:aminotransferase class V-fold PLP-dependent enzyme [Patulibacter sp.]MDO9408157.1 aminotransferase class V-fold PLP-dependent enzyme [Patulibacter sp.]
MSTIETVRPHAVDRAAASSAPTTPAPAAIPTAAAEPVAATADRPLLPVVGGDLRVPLLDGSTVRFANLDYAATAPALTAVAERVARVLPFSGSVHRGAGLPSQVSSALYEAARRSVGAALGARADDLVVFTRNTTDATNLLASAVPGEVVTLDLEHHANLLPWARAAGHRCVAHAGSIEETLARLDAELARRPAALLALTGASNVTGELLPVQRAAAIAHAHGARLFVDAAQLAPHRAVDLVALGADYLALSGHKLYAPYGSGVLVGRRDWLDAAAPYLAGGGAVREVATPEIPATPGPSVGPSAGPEPTTTPAATGPALTTTVEWAPGPARHEGGTPNLVGAVAIAAAFEALGALDDDAREAHEETLRRRVLDGLADVEGVQALRIWEGDGEAIGVVAFAVDGYAPGLVGAYLSAEHGIGVRDGRFCAHPLLNRFGRPEGALRASFGVGSRAADADRLVEALRRLVDEGPRHAYCETPGGWVPEHDTRDLAAWTGLDLGLESATPATRSPCGNG